MDYKPTTIHGTEIIISYRSNRALAFHSYTNKVSYLDKNQMMSKCEGREVMYSKEVLEKDAQGVIFYIIEEAIGNARKHAEANNVLIRLRYSPGTFLVEIEDDGKGFDFDGVMDDYSTRGSLGMTNMHERTELVNGRISIESQLGKGTKITLRVPVRE